MLFRARQAVPVSVLLFGGADCEGVCGGLARNVVVHIHPRGLPRVMFAVLVVYVGRYFGTFRGIEGGEGERNAGAQSSRTATT